MKITRLILNAILIWLIATPTNASAFSTRTESWIEEAHLHDGRIIKVHREVGSTLQVFSGDGGSPGFMKSWPDKYWLKFTNPDTQEIVKWQGEQNFNPILLDIVDGVPYLVINGSPDKKTEKIYGCPELPYIYLKYGKGIFGKWTPISASQAPKTLQKANLSLSHPDHLQHKGLTHYYLSYKDIQNNIKLRGGNLNNGKIPASYGDWEYPYKASYKTNRKKK